MLIALSLAVATWSGIIPRQIANLAPIDLADKHAWFVDLRLAALSNNRALCRTTLTSPLISARPIADKPFVDGCGWRNAVALSGAGRLRVTIDELTCETAAATAMWVTHVLQPAAEQHLQVPVVALQTMGGYSCRNIVGNKLWQDFRSQHATANAIDISAFELQDGRVISIKKHWASTGPQADFLRAVHNGACRYFRVVLGPDYNAAHRDHFHLDRGYLKSCK